MGFFFLETLKQTNRIYDFKREIDYTIDYTHFEVFIYYIMRLVRNEKGIDVHFFDSLKLILK